MRTTNKIIGIIAVILFVGAGVAWQRSQHFIHQYRWIVLEQPIHLQDGFSISHPFTVDVAAKYWIDVECRKTVPFDILDHTLTKKLAAEFAVASGAERIASGDTSQELSMGYTAASISRHIATFEAVPAVSYNLTLRVTTSLPEIASTSPTVKVSVEPLVFKSAFVVASLWAYLALGLAFIGVLCLIPVAWTFLFQRSNHKTRNT
jgi:hypothetical protein